MKITDELVLYLEKLARIELPADEREKCRGDLQDILSYMDTLNELDTEGVEPLSHSFPVVNVMREDVVGQSADREDILRNAPKRKDGCFNVPKTVD